MKYCEKCLTKNGKFDFFVMTLQTSCGAIRQGKRVTLQTHCDAERVKYYEVGHTHLLSSIARQEVDDGSVLYCQSMLES